jgi:hypothetical protein
MNSTSGVTKHRAVMAKPLKQRQQELRERREREGLKRKEYWATPSQHKEIKKLINS